MAGLASRQNVHREVCKMDPPMPTCPYDCVAHMATDQEKTHDSCNQTFDLHSQQSSGLPGTYFFSEGQ